MLDAKVEHHKLFKPVKYAILALLAISTLSLLIYFTLQFSRLSAKEQLDELKFTDDDDRIRNGHGRELPRNKDAYEFARFILGLGKSS